MAPKYDQDNILLVQPHPYEAYCRSQQENRDAYSAGHRAQVRKKIIQSARQLFNRHGFENVSLAQIMSGAGLTHGGFYKYFKSKSDLYAEVLGCFLTDPEWKSCWEGVHVDLSSTDVGPQVVRPTCLASISRTSRTRAQWSPCPATSLAAARARSELSKTCCAQWSTFWNAASLRRIGAVMHAREQLLLYA
jgi:hypothetical protein